MARVTIRDLEETESPSAESMRHVMGGFRTSSAGNRRLPEDPFAPRRAFPEEPFAPGRHRVPGDRFNRKRTRFPDDPF